jgi:pimeloyl-ACP methyl ester carboxylesterase
VRRYILLPGMHGTAALSDDFLATAPADGRAEVAELPMERLGYDALAERLAPTLRLDADTVLVAESFSGPLAILLAERHPLAALVFCSTFARHPYPRALGALPLELLARIRPPAALVRYYIVGTDAPDDLVRQARVALAAVPPRVLAFRARCALDVDVTAQLRRCALPMLYLRGTHDHLVREKSVREMIAATSARMSVARIAGPHMLLTTAPEESWRIMTQFTSQIG